MMKITIEQARELVKNEDAERFPCAVMNVKGKEALVDFCNDTLTAWMELSYRLDDCDQDGRLADKVRKLDDAASGYLVGESVRIEFGAHSTKSKLPAIFRAEIEMFDWFLAGS